MIPIEGVYIELRSDAPERLAAFYERLAGMKRAPGSAVVLTASGLTLAIKPSLGEPPDEGSITFGFRVPDGSDPTALRAAATADGAVLLSESKRDNLAMLSCQDPDGNAFVVIAMQPAVAVDAVPVRVEPPPQVNAPPVARVPDVVAPTNPPVSRVPDVAAPTPRPVPPPVARPSMPPAGNRPTRRDVDRLRDMERLASMAESIAGLDMPFTEDDPAHIMDRMRSKIPVVSEAEIRAREADAELRAREKQAAVDDMLSQYRAQLRPESAPVTPAAPPATDAATHPPTHAEAPPPRIDDPVLADLDAPHTLGPSGAVSPDEPDPIQAEAPRTLGRSKGYDDDEDTPSQ